MLRGLLLALCALAVIAPAAVAADDQIFVDPDSPSGKEYALPVDSARRQAAGATQGAKDRAAPTPLFGEGVGAAGSKAGTATGTGKASGGAKAGTDDGATASAGASTAPARTAAPKTLKAQAAAPDGGIGVAAAIGGVSVGVLLLGAAIGVLLRRRAARST